MSGHGGEHGGGHEEASHDHHSAQNITGVGMIKGVADAILGFMDKGWATPLAQASLDTVKDITDVASQGQILGSKPAAKSKGASASGGHGGH